MKHLLIIFISLFSFTVISCSSSSDDGSKSTTTETTISVGSDGYVASAQLSAFDYPEWTVGAFINSSMRNNLLKSVYSYFKDEFDFIFLLQNETESNLGYHGMYIGGVRYGETGNSTPRGITHSWDEGDQDPMVDWDSLTATQRAAAQSLGFSAADFWDV